MGVTEGFGSSLDCLEELLHDERAEREIVLTRNFDAPLQLPWDAWTDSAQRERWWGPRGFTTTTHAATFEPGGVWRFTMHGPDGRDYPNQVELLALEPRRRIVYRHAGDEGVRFETTVHFEQDGPRTRLTMSMRFASSAARARVEAQYGAVEGGLETLQRLAGHLGSGLDLLAVAYPHSRQTVLRRSFDAPRALVFEAFSKPEHIRRWWGPRDKTMHACTTDFRVGGSWRFVLRDNADGREHPFCGEYRELIPPERIVQTFVYDVPGSREHASLETLTLDEQDGRTVLTVTVEHGVQGACARSTGMESGAAQSYERLAALLQSLAGLPS